MSSPGGVFNRTGTQPERNPRLQGSPPIGTPKSKPLSQWTSSSIGFVALSWIILMVISHMYVCIEEGEKPRFKRTRRSEICCSGSAILQVRTELFCGGKYKEPLSHGANRVGAHEDARMALRQATRSNQGHRLAIAAQLGPRTEGLVTSVKPGSFRRHRISGRCAASILRDRHRTGQRRARILRHLAHSHPSPNNLVQTQSSSPITP